MKAGRGGAGKGARGGKKQTNQSTLDDYDADMQLPQKGTSTPKFAENLQIKKGKSSSCLYRYLSESKHPNNRSNLGINHLTLYPLFA